jgi:hypothetical protein
MTTSTSKRAVTTPAPWASVSAPAAPPGTPSGAVAAVTPRGRPLPGRSRGARSVPGGGVPGKCAPPTGFQVVAGQRTWALEFPAGMELLTGNNRLSRYPKARVVKALREQGWGAAVSNRLPPIERADIHVTYLPPPRLRKDRHPFASARIEDSENLAPTGKALIDGIAQAGTFGGGDSRKHVRRVTYELLPGTCPRGQVTLHITEVSP